MACKDAGISTWWSALSGFCNSSWLWRYVKGFRFNAKIFSKILAKNNVWTYLSFDKKECEEECAKQVRPLLITSLEDEIKGIEQGIKDLEAKKAQLQELKKAQSEDSFKYVNSEK